MKRIILILTMILSVGMLRANHWNPNAGQFADYMTVTAVVQINGVEQQSTRLELGAFCGDEVRGSKYAQLAPNGRYLFRLPCWGNAGDAFTFRLYDADLDEELDYLVCETVLTYNTNGYGGLQTPYVLDFNGSNTQTYNLSIAGYGNSAGGYYLIAPPFDNVNPDDIAGMTEGDFDLYYFDESQDGEEWHNYKTDHFNLESGKGYLYAHSTDVTLSFTGMPYTGNGQFPLAYTEGKPFTGWNLIGNPYSVAATLDRDFYVMKNDGTEIIAAETETIDAMQGVFVVAEQAGETASFQVNATPSNKAKIVLNICRNSSNVVDRAIVRFGEGGMLRKIMLNEANTKVFIPQGNDHYAVVCSNNEDEIPVSFKAAENGTYTLSVNTENVELEYLHLIDNMTGADIDLLQTSNYCFEAQTTDYASRFKLVFGSTNGILENQESFAYYNGNAWTISNRGYATLQLVDMRGCVVNTQTINGNAEVSINAPTGIYMLRLIDSECVKVQKVVVR